MLSSSLSHSSTPLYITSKKRASHRPLGLYHIFFIVFDNLYFDEKFITGVAGGAASGKTTVCDLIIQQLCDHRVVLISQVCLKFLFQLIWCSLQFFFFFEYIKEAHNLMSIERVDARYDECVTSWI